MLNLKRRLKRVCVTAVWITAAYYFSLIAFGLQVTPLAADIAVVLGNEVLKTGEPADRLAARVDCALELYRKKLVNKIMVSGGKSASGFDEATVMAQRLVKNGIAPSDIIIDSEGINTMATALNTAKIMKARHYKTAIIVTQYFHIPRTQLAFHMAGITSYSADYPRFFELRDIFSTFREMVAIPVYWLTKRG